MNSRRELGWKAWEDARFTSRDIPPHEAVKSVLAAHGPAAFERYHMAVFRAYHVHKRDVANPLELLAIAREVDIDTTVLAEDLRTRKYKKKLGQITKRRVSRTTFWGADYSLQWPGAHVCETRRWRPGKGRKTSSSSMTCSRLPCGPMSWKSKSLPRQTWQPPLQRVGRAMRRGHR